MSLQFFLLKTFKKLIGDSYLSFLRDESENKGESYAHKEDKHW